MTTPTNPDETKAQVRFLVTNMVRIASLAGMLVGIATVQDAFPLPYAAGLVLTVLGLGGFFFAPPLLARHWVKQHGKPGE